jgi:hypothetical protein
MNYWQAAIEDVGPAGVDKGKGGKYLILPPTTKIRSLTGYIPFYGPQKPRSDKTWRLPDIGKQT